MHINYIEVSEYIVISDYLMPYKCSIEDTERRLSNILTQANTIPPPDLHPLANTRACCYIDEQMWRV